MNKIILSFSLILILCLSGCININLDYNTNRLDKNGDFNSNININSNNDLNEEFIQEINIFENTDSNLIIKTRKELRIKELENINTNSENRTITNINLDPIELKECSLNTKTQKIDLNNYTYKTFNFTYKNYEFEYKIKLFLDLVNYSSELKYQNCYKFDNNESALRYTQDKYNNELIKKIANDFNSLSNKFNKNEIIEIAIRFVQQIPYNYDSNVENRYPYETLFLGKGVCLDKTIILSELLGYLDYETYIVVDIFDPINNIPHSTVGIICETGKYNLNNKQFCQIETTNKFFVDELNYDGNMKVLSISNGKIYIEDSYGPKTNLKYNTNLDLMKQIELELNKYKTNPKIYNKYVNEYNNLLYENISLRFENYQ